MALRHFGWRQAKVGQGDMGESSPMMAQSAKDHAIPPGSHNLENSKLGEKSWTKFYTHIKEKNIKSFKKKNLEVKAGTAIIFISSLVHSGYPSTKKGSLRITITERLLIVELQNLLQVAA